MLSLFLAGMGSPCFLKKKMTDTHTHTDRHTHTHLTRPVQSGRDNKRQRQTNKTALIFLPRIGNAAGEGGQGMRRVGARRRSVAQESASFGNVGAAAAVVVLVVDDEQHHCQEEADRAHCDVGDAQEGVLATHPRDGAQDHALTAVKAAHGVI